MKQRVITGILFALGVFAFFIPSYWFPVFIVLFSILVGSFAIYEMYKALCAGNMKPSLPLLIGGGVLSVLIFAVSWAKAFSIFEALTLYLLIIGIYCFSCGIIPAIYIKDGSGLKRGIATAGIVFYVTFPLFCLMSGIALVDNGWFYMVAGLFGCWISDVCAYFVGVTLGKHKIVPHISPKKTWEGCVGGAAGCAILLMVYFDLVVYEVDGITTNIVIFSIVMFILGFILSCLSQIGDWLASLVKRWVGIKDYGKIFPGHGGMMDRFDSAFFTIPAGLLIAVIASIFF